MSPSKYFTLMAICFGVFVCRSVIVQDFDYDSAIKIAKTGDDMIQTVKSKLVY